MGVEVQDQKISFGGLAPAFPGYLLLVFCVYRADSVQNIVNLRCPLDS